MRCSLPPHCDRWVHPSTPKGGPSSPIRWTLPKEGDEAGRKAWARPKFRSRRIHALGFMVNKFHAPQPELLTHLMLSFKLCLKHDQRVVPGASKEHQATFPPNTLSVGRYELIPWAMVGPALKW